MTESIPKLGDRFAVITSGFGVSHVTGPWYVIGVRSSRVALGMDPTPNPKAKREWAARNDGTMWETSRRFSSAHAERWTEKHRLAQRREARAASLRAHMDRLSRSRLLDCFTDEEIETFYNTIVVMPASLQAAFEHLEDATSSEIDKLDALGFIQSSGEGVEKKWTANARGTGALARARSRS